MVDTVLSLGPALPASACRSALFPICPHVRVTYLTSTSLSRVAHRLPAGWQARYGYTSVTDCWSVAERRR
jgi:hypothetical protein